MSDDASSKPGLKIVPPPASENVFDDVEALRTVATLKVSRRVVPVNVAVRKPPNSVYFRVHDDQAAARAYRLASIASGKSGITILNSGRMAIIGRYRLHCLRRSTAPAPKSRCGVSSYSRARGHLLMLDQIL